MTLERVAGEERGLLRAAWPRSTVFQNEKVRQVERVAHAQHEEEAARAAQAGRAARGARGAGRPRSRRRTGSRARSSRGTSAGTGTGAAARGRGETEGVEDVALHHDQGHEAAEGVDVELAAWRAGRAPALRRAGARGGGQRAHARLRYQAARRAPSAACLHVLQQHGLGSRAHELVRSRPPPSWAPRRRGTSGPAPG